jgi:hypothetical protein
VPRATGDLDFWIRRTEENAARVMRALREFGAPTGDLAIADLVTPDLVFQIGIEPNRIDILTSIDGVEFEEAWAERMITHIDELDVPILSLRHVIVNKRAVGRPRDVADVAALAAEQQRRAEAQEGRSTPKSR